MEAVKQGLKILPKKGAKMINPPSPRTHSLTFPETGVDSHHEEDDAADDHV